MANDVIEDLILPMVLTIATSLVAWVFAITPFFPSATVHLPSWVFWSFLAVTLIVGEIVYLGTARDWWWDIEEFRDHPYAYKLFGLLMGAWIAPWAVGISWGVSCLVRDIFVSRGSWLPWVGYGTIVLAGIALFFVSNVWLARKIMVQPETKPKKKGRKNNGSK